MRCGGRFPSTEVDEIAVTSDGVVDLAVLERRLTELKWDEERPPLVSIMAANNETGAIQPIREAAALVHGAGGLLHVDAIQTVGRMPFDLSEMEADLVSVSAHKLGGPQGVGALIKRSSVINFCEPLMRGGGQERGARAGTENVAGIAGFGAAAVSAAATIEGDSERMRALRDRLEEGLAADQAVIFCRNVDRLPNTTLFAVPGLRAETALINLDLDGIAVSSGSACSSGKVTPSHVLAAMGVPKGLVAGAIRVSLGPTTSENEIDHLLKAWTKLLAGLSKVRSGLAA